MAQSGAYFLRESNASIVSDMDKTLSRRPLPRSLGRNGPAVFPLGLGCMGMSDFYGPSDRGESLATIRAALDAGVDLLDTGDFYGMGHNELLIAEALRAVPRERVQISVKFGALRDPAGNWLGYDGRPAAVRNFAAYSLRRLGTDHIDIYRLGRVDPAVPIEETVGAIARLIEEGCVRHVGLGGGAPPRRSCGASVADLQIEYSLVSRGIETEILPACRELGVAITAYGVLSRGLLSGHWSADRQTSPEDFRTHLPRFAGENLERNLTFVERLGALAAVRGVTTAQLAVAWVLSRGSDIVPLVGARRRDQLHEALGSLSIDLDAGELQAIEEALPVGALTGDRYPGAHMAHLDSERRAYLRRPFSQAPSQVERTARRSTPSSRAIVSTMTSGTASHQGSANRWARSCRPTTSGRWAR